MSISCIIIEIQWLKIWLNYTTEIGVPGLKSPEYEIEYYSVQRKIEFATETDASGLVCMVL